MKALQYTAIGKPPEVVDIEQPSPASGQVLLRVAAAGVCHSDAFIMSLPEDQYTYGLPLTLGHEGVGVVHELGAGVTGVKVGQLVAVYGPRGCGHCVPCSRGEENYCLNAVAEGITPPGLGSPGAMAEYLLIEDDRHLVPIDGLDPVDAVSLTDAGLTPYHAIKGELDLLRPGSTAVVIGAGGLGHVGIQILKAITAARVIALDISARKRELATEVGADHAIASDEEAVSKIIDITGGIGADVVFDCVGSDATLTIARECVRINGAISIIGIGGGLLPAGFFSTPFGVRVRNPYWGTRDELFEVFELARAGRVRVEVERFDLEDGPRAYERLHEGSIGGRAVLVP